MSEAADLRALVIAEGMDEARVEANEGAAMIAAHGQRCHVAAFVPWDGEQEWRVYGYRDGAGRRGALRAGAVHRGGGRGRARDARRARRLDACSIEPRGYRPDTPPMEHATRPRRRFYVHDRAEGQNTHLARFSFVNPRYRVLDRDKPGEVVDEFTTKREATATAADCNRAERAGGAS